MQNDQSLKSRHAGTKRIIFFRHKLKTLFLEKTPPFGIYHRCSCVSWQHVKCMKNVFEILLETKSSSSSKAFPLQNCPSASGSLETLNSSGRSSILLVLQEKITNCRKVCSYFIVLYDKVHIARIAQVTVPQT